MGNPRAGLKYVRSRGAAPGPSRRCAGARVARVQVASATYSDSLALARGLLDLRHLVHVGRVHRVALARGEAAAARRGGSCDTRARRPRPALDALEARTPPGAT
eukprot:1891976-Prymnesium_polylepis.1